MYNPEPRKPVQSPCESTISMEVCCESQKLGHFGGHFELLQFSDVKRCWMSKILPDLDSMSNLAVETTVLRKKSIYAQHY